MNQLANQVKVPKPSLRTREKEREREDEACDDGVERELFEQGLPAEGKKR